MFNNSICKLLKNGFMLVIAFIIEEGALSKCVQKHQKGRGGLGGT